MKNTPPTSSLSLDELLDRYVEIGLAQDDAVFDDRVHTFNRLFDEQIGITDELRTRAGDQRRLLKRFYDHPSLQVRLNAANATLALFPEEARRVIEEIAKLKPNPHAGNAGMTLWAIDNGISNPS